MMPLQKEAFLTLTGDHWYDSNRDDLGKVDPVSMLLQAHEIRPTAVMEIGCSDGWRLRRLKKKYGCRVTGIDPSRKAILDGIQRGSSADEIYVRTADDLSFWPDEHYDLLIYGYCFSYVDPKLYFKVLSEGDRVLRDGGWLFIHDWIAPFPIKRHYADVHYGDGDGRDVTVYGYEMDFSSLWTGHPFYAGTQIMARDPDKYIGVIGIQKNIIDAFMMGGNTPAVHNRPY